MAARLPEDSSSRAAPTRGILRRAMARALSAREARARQTVRAYLLGLDDATLATLGYNRSALDEAGRDRFPL